MNDFVTHTFEPVYNSKTKVLILGTIPSPKSREVGFYYSHPQNKFWRITADLLQQPVPNSYEQKKQFLLNNNIGLWDVLKSCNIKGADDNSIKEPQVNDIASVLASSDIKAIFTTGAKAFQLYKRYCMPNINIPCISLPSTSPANCRFYSYESLKDEYKIILEYLK